MTIHATMREAAARAQRPLADSGSADAVVGFVTEQLCDDGGFAGRAGGGDLYYTLFALAALDALGAGVPGATGDFLKRFGPGDALDLVHVSALARCWTYVPGGPPDGPVRDGMLARLGELRCGEGGFSHVPEATTPTAYGCFLALGAMQDLQVPPDDFGPCIERMRSADGGYANVPDMPAGSTPATAAAVVTLRQLDLPVSPRVAPWLLSQYRGGGFGAALAAPMPDLLSTATALHALAQLAAPLDDIREPCLDFVDSLWTGTAFAANLADPIPDCEYTYYGLLALGHLTT